MKNYHAENKTARKPRAIDNEILLSKLGLALFVSGEVRAHL